MTQGDKTGWLPLPRHPILHPFPGVQIPTASSSPLPTAPLALVTQTQREDTASFPARWRSGMSSSAACVILQTGRVGARHMSPE